MAIMLPNHGNNLPRPEHPKELLHQAVTPAGVSTRPPSTPVTLCHHSWVLAGLAAQSQCAVLLLSAAKFLG